MFRPFLLHLEAGSNTDYCQNSAHYREHSAQRTVH